MVPTYYIKHNDMCLIFRFRMGLVLNHNSMHMPKSQFSSRHNNVFMKSNFQLFYIDGLKIDFMPIIRIL